MPFWLTHGVNENCTAKEEKEGRWKWVSGDDA